MKSLSKRNGFLTKTLKGTPVELQKTPSRSPQKGRPSIKTSPEDQFHDIKRIIPDFRPEIRSSSSPSSPYVFQSVLPEDFKTFYSTNEEGEIIPFQPPYKGAELTPEEIAIAKQSAMMTREIIDRIQKALTFLRNNDIKTMKSNKLIALSNELNLIHRMEGFFSQREIQEIKDWIGFIRVNISLNNASDILKTDPFRFDLMLIKGLIDDVEGSLLLPQYLTKEEYQLLYEHKENLKHLFLYKNAMNIYDDYLRRYEKFFTYADQKLIDRYTVISALLKTPLKLSRTDYNNFNLLNNFITDILNKRGIMVT